MHACTLSVRTDRALLESGQGLAPGLNRICLVFFIIAAALVNNGMFETVQIRRRLEGCGRIRCNRLLDRRNHGTGADGTQFEEAIVLVFYIG